MYKDAQMR